MNISANELNCFLPTLSIPYLAIALFYVNGNVDNKMR